MDWRSTSFQRLSRGTTTGILRRISLSWLTILLGTYSAGAWFLPKEVLESIRDRDYFLLSIGSLLVSYLNVLPLALADRVQDDDRLNSNEPKAAAETINGTLLSGIIIRFAGTIALFVLGRYQLASAEQSVAFVVILWYIVLSVITTRAVAAEVKKGRQSAIKGYPGEDSSADQ